MSAYPTSKISNWGHNKKTKQSKNLSTNNKPNQTKQNTVAHLPEESTTKRKEALLEFGINPP